MSRTESEFLRHEACPNCDSSDANSVYDDGHKYCFSCGSYTNGDGEVVKAQRSGESLIKLDRGEHRPLHKRGINLATAQFFDYTFGQYRNRAAQFAPYYDKNRNLVACHVKMMRQGKKTFSWVIADGIKMNDLMPYGAHRFAQGGRKIVVTEGEIDAMSMSQVQDNKWPVVSIPTGAGPQVKKYFAAHRDWFSRFDEVVIMFDMDDPGREAAELAAQTIGSKARIAELPMKDPNEMLQNGEVKNMLTAMWNAQPYRPQGVLTLSSLRDKVLAGVEYGLSFPYDFMTEWTYGIRLGEIHTFGAGTGAGKTDLFTEIAYHLMHEHEESVAMFMFEQEPQETAIRLCGKAGDKRFHIPNNPEVPTDNDWTTEELEGAFDKLQHDRHVFLYDSFGANDWDDVQETIRFLRHSEGVRYFFIDHITALSEWKTDTRAELEKMMAEMAGLVKEINSTIFLVSHLATPEGKSHEEGGRVTVRHYKGSRAIGTYSHFIWALERDQQAESEDIRHTSTVRCLKDRYTGNGTGKTSLLKYNQQTGRLFEKPKDMAAGVDFEDETADAENATEKGDDF